MGISVAAAWRMALTIALCAAILCSVSARPPRRSVPARDLACLMLCALLLYAVGALAQSSRHQLLAVLVFGAGIMLCTLAAWLSRGRDREDPLDADEPPERWPPPEPDGVPKFDWDAFERDFRAYERSGRSRSPA
jgi:hypothetical protein